MAEVLQSNCVKAHPFLRYDADAHLAQNKGSADCLVEHNCVGRKHLDRGTGGLDGTNDIRK
jgi:hypothetical protein